VRRSGGGGRLSRLQYEKLRVRVCWGVFPVSAPGTPSEKVPDCRLRPNEKYGGRVEKYLVVSQSAKLMDTSHKIITLIVYRPQIIVYGTPGV
jgi:hypothetical protein